MPKGINVSIKFAQDQARRLSAYLNKAGLPARDATVQEALAALHGYDNWSSLIQAAQACGTLNDARDMYVASRLAEPTQLEGMEVPVWAAFNRCLLSAPFFDGVHRGRETPFAFHDGRLLYVLANQVVPAMRPYILGDDGKPLGNSVTSVDNLIARTIHLALVSALTKKGWLRTQALGSTGPTSVTWSVRVGRANFEDVLILGIPAGMKLAQPAVGTSVDVAELGRAGLKRLAD